MSWLTQTQGEIDEIWSQLANDMEDQFFSEVRCKFKGSGKTTRWLHQKVRQKESKAKGLEGRECLAGLLREFSDVCKSSIVEGMSPEMSTT